MAARQMVFPGDEVAIAEEFLPGPGTYEENGNVYAARIGILKLDPNEFVAKVEPVTLEPSVLRVGDIVIGVVGMMKASMCVVEVVKKASEPERTLGCDTNGTLHIGKISDSYVENIDEAYRPTDIIRAEVTSIDPSLQLTTKGAKLGVLKAFCPRCRTAFVRKENVAVCPECEWKDPRKFAADYGEGKLLFEGPEPPPEPRGGGRPRFGGGRGEGRGRGGDRGDRRGGFGGRGERREGRGGYGGGRGGDRGPRGPPRERRDERPREAPRESFREERPREERPREARAPEERPREDRPRDEPSREGSGEGGQRRRRGRRGGRGRRRGGGGGPGGPAGGE